jgi:hypothetical protein
VTRRRIANRESARRVRQKRQDVMDELQAKVCEDRHKHMKSPFRVANDNF